MEKGYSVLLIDDDSGLRMLVRLLLEHESFRVLLAPDGEIGLALAQGERPDCILLDMAMPRRNGMDVYLDLQNSSASGIPVIIFSAALNRRDEEIWRSLPYVVDVIRKPFDIQLLVSRIREICSRPQAVSQRQEL
jgi:DNA-binding response OmpR family regulator